MVQDLLVKKRDGSLESLQYEKINKVVMWATEGINGVSASEVIMKSDLQLFNQISTEQIHNVLIKSAIDLISEETPNYQMVASRLQNYLLRKQVFKTGGDNLPHLMDLVEKNVDLGLYDPTILDYYTTEEFDKLNSYLRHQRDYDFSSAGIQQCIDKYLLQDRLTRKIYETPQYMFMLIAMTVYRNVNKDERIKLIRTSYNAYSNLKVNLPTPILANVRKNNRQYSSCTLIDVGDSLESIASSTHSVLRYSSKGAGIGLNMGRIRSIGSGIRGGDVVHTGVIPYLKVMESTVKSCIQGGLRGGGATVHFPFWHHEIMDVMVLKNNKGTDDNRVRKLDYSIQFNKLFYERFIKGGEITLFSPHEVPDLYEAFFKGYDEFKELYEKYEKSRSVKKIKLPAKEMMNLYVQERSGTGRIYLFNSDNINGQYSPFKDPIYMSNLCQEITLPQKPLESIDDEDGEISLCVLSSINMGNIKDLSELEQICEVIVRTLDFVIEEQDYPVKAAEKMLGRRSIGVGVTNYAYWLAKQGLNYDSPESLEVTDKWFEHFQYYLIKASVTLAKELGACSLFDKTTYSEGILPIDRYNKNMDDVVSRELTLDWETLRSDVKEFGMRNSVLSAIAPTESSSVLHGATNGIEPPRSLITTKDSKAGKIKVVVPEIHKLKNKYQLAWDLQSNQGLIKLQGVMQKWIDQSISSNHYYNPKQYDDNKIPMKRYVTDILLSHKLGIKTLYYANTNDGSTDDLDDMTGCSGGACSV